MDSGSPDASSALGDDQHTTVRELKAIVREFVDERQWQSFHNPKNLVMSLAIETGELMEHFQWLTLEESSCLADDISRKNEVGKEVADCLAYLLALANAMDLDLSTSLRDKMVENREKYPVGHPGH